MKIMILLFINNIIIFNHYLYACIPETHELFIMNNIKICGFDPGTALVASLEI